MRYAPRALLAGGLGFAVSFLVACGGGAGLLSGNDADNLDGKLANVSSAVEAGHCRAAAHAAASLGSAVQQLPRTVNRKLRNNLNQGARTIAELAQRNCRPATHQPHTTSTTTTTTTATTTTQTTPAATNTTPTNTNTQPQNTNTQPPVTSTTGPGTTSTSSGGAGLGNSGNGVGAGANGNGQ
jgi:hypothetical protein